MNKRRSTMLAYNLNLFNFYLKKKVSELEFIDRHKVEQVGNQYLYI